MTFRICNCVIEYINYPVLVRSVSSQRISGERTEYAVGGDCRSDGFQPAAEVIVRLESRGRRVLGLLGADRAGDGRLVVALQAEHEGGREALETDLRQRERVQLLCLARFCVYVFRVTLL